MVGMMVMCAVVVSRAEAHKVMLVPTVGGSFIRNLLNLCQVIFGSVPRAVSWSIKESRSLPLAGLISSAAETACAAGSFIEVINLNCSRFDDLLNH